ncbi:MAG: hypothetical protein PHX08_17285 [Lachnospiraceae bacterium]|nr:hypothetical protein [Lachnospiraceae bacterium]
MNKNTSVLYMVKEVNDRNAILVNDMELITVPKYQLPSELEVGQEIIKDLFGMYHRPK